MKIYQDRFLISRFPAFRRRTGEVLSRCIGANFTVRDGKVTVEPVYLPLLKFTKQGGMIAIDVAFTDLFAVIILFPKFPFVSAIRVQGELGD
jgi:hypothetical protein